MALKRLTLLGRPQKKNGDADTNKSPKQRRTLIVQDGVLIISIAALVVFSAAARGVNLLMALGAFFVGFLVVDYLWGRRTLRDINVARKLPETVYAGEPFYVEIELDAAKRSSSSWALVVEDHWEHEDPEFDAPAVLKKEVSKAEDESDKKDDDKLANKATKKSKIKKTKKLMAKQASKTDAALHEGVETLRPVVYFPTLHKRERCSEYYLGVCTRRGVRRLKTLTLSTRFPCGFFCSMERFDAAAQMIVFPKIGRLTYAWNSFVAGSVAQEASVSTSLTSRIPDETVSIRDWRSGDSKRTIAWRATAKRDRLQSREFTKRQTRTVVTILDLWQETNDRNADAVKRWENVETAIAFVATWIEKYAEYGDSQLYFTLNGEIPVTSDLELPYAKLETTNDASEDWDTLHGGSSTRRVLTRLALAKPPKVDKLRETLDSIGAFNLRNAQVFVISVEPIDSKRLDLKSWKNVRFVDVSSPSFESYFQQDEQVSDQY